MISVISITFNNYDDLVKTLNSIKELSIEPTVVNGGSCQKTLGLLSSHHGLSVSEKDKGISDAFNKGLSLSHGDAVVYLNSGDILIDKNYYKEAEEILNSCPEISFIYADILLKDSMGGVLIVKSNGRLPNMPFMHPTLIVRRSVFEKIGNFDLQFKSAMDLDFAYRMLHAGYKGHYIPRVVVEMDGAGISSLNYWLSFKEKVQVLLKNQDYSLRTWMIMAGLGLNYLVRQFLLVLGLKGIIGSYRKYKHR